MYLRKKRRASLKKWLASYILLAASRLLRHNPPPAFVVPTWLLGKQLSSPGWHNRSEEQTDRSRSRPEAVVCLHFQGLCCYDAMPVAETWLASRSRTGILDVGEGGASHADMARRKQQVVALLDIRLRLWAAETENDARAHHRRIAGLAPPSRKYRRHSLACDALAKPRDKRPRSLGQIVAAVALPVDPQPTGG